MAVYVADQSTAYVTGPVTLSDYGTSFIVSDTGGLIQPTRLTLSSGLRVTLSGTGRFTIYDPSNNPPHKVSSSPGSFILRSGEFILQYARLTLPGNQRATLTENARVVLFGFGPSSRVVLQGGPS